MPSLEETKKDDEAVGRIATYLQDHVLPEFARENPELVVRAMFVAGGLYAVKKNVDHVVPVAATSVVLTTAAFAQRRKK